MPGSTSSPYTHWQHLASTVLETARVCIQQSNAAMLLHSCLEHTPMKQKLIHRYMHAQHVHLVGCYGLDMREPNINSK